MSCGPARNPHLAQLSAETLQSCHPPRKRLHTCRLGPCPRKPRRPWLPLAPRPSSSSFSHQPPIPDKPSIRLYFAGSESPPIRRQDGEECDSGLACRGGGVWGWSSPTIP